MIKKAFIFVTLILLLTSTTILGILFFKSVDPHNVIKAFSPGEVNIVIEDKPIKIDAHPIITGEKIYIPVEILKEYIYENIKLDEKNDRLYVNIEKPYFRLETEELDKRIKDGIKLNFLTRKFNNIHYLNIKGLEKVFGISLHYAKASKILTIDKVEDERKVGTIKEKTYLRPRKSSFSFWMDKLSVGSKVMVFDNEGKWVKVRTDKGYIGYILNRKVDVQRISDGTDKKLNSVREDVEFKNKINLVWDHVYKYSSDLSKEEKIEGLNVISPTWFSVVEPNGYIENKGDIEYVKDAHEKGYMVWGLIDNSFNKDLTHKILKDKEAQENVINQILVYSSIYDLDGINIDFENVYYEDKDRLTKFVDKLTKELKKQNLIVSMDMTVPSSSLNWSKFYDREKLGKIVDYCMVMTYDEHWASSPKSGSVASIGWVERGIQKTLKYIPKEKLVMGVPFYTREWEEVKLRNGRVKVRSKALSMEKVEERIKEYNLKPVWLEETGQYYIEYTKEGKKYRIWIEDERSIKLKSLLIHKYNLAGVASWRKGFEKENVWQVLNDTINRDSQLVMN
ncbi:glycosyl hydrolase family 18 protein [Thermohalobacter berrensis]|uniref:GH18 domain-containing protein n=1 Tax=Thermohalobacter berrensis TaxID=99594 RepID=A0A419T5U8_9FIRM|nr:glycosyl hydrolase family 18 protein [Thermohalobacter berrensis]RKD32957.1 hypothetical protein BET03_10095 [Thermohalobacter berrensis]